MKNITLKKKMTEIIEMCPNKNMEEMMIMIRTLTIQECKRKFKAKPDIVSDKGGMKRCFSYYH